MNAGINQGWKILSGPLFLIIIPLFLSEVEQGFWYTFISLSALSVFANLGFSTILLQFSAHEFAHLKVQEDGSLSGDSVHLFRLSSLWKFSMSWSVIVGFIAFIIILIFGLIFIGLKKIDISWHYPWLIYGGASFLVFLNSMALSFFEGCDDVKGAHGIRFKMGVITVLSAICFLYLDFGLYSLGYSVLISSIFGVLMICLSKRVVIKQFYNLNSGVGNWKQEILPLLKRYSLSWVSGYFIFQAFTPLAFYFYGPVAAGKVGLTIAIFYAIFSISNVWLTIITPKINIYISKSNRAHLNYFFKRSVFLSAFSFILGASIFFTAIKYIPMINFLNERLVPFFSILCVALGWFFQIFINAMAVYVRAHKVEPFVFLSFANAIYIVSVTFLSSVLLPFDYFFVGFFTSFVLFSYSFYNIFKQYYFGVYNV